MMNFIEEIIKFIIIIMVIINILYLSVGIYRVSKIKKQKGSIVIRKTGIWKSITVGIIIYNIIIMILVTKINFVTFIIMIAVPTYFDYDRRVMIIRDDRVYILAPQNIEFKNIKSMEIADNSRMHIYLKTGKMIKIYIKDKKKLMDKYNSYLEKNILDEIK